MAKKKKYKIRIARVFTLLALFILVVALIIILSVKNGSSSSLQDPEASVSPSATENIIADKTPAATNLPSPEPTTAATPTPTVIPSATPTPTLPPLTPTPTPRPTPTVTPTPGLKKDPNALSKPTKKMTANSATGKLTGNSVKLRQGPSTNTPIVASGLSKNAELTVYPTNDKDFYFVKVNSLRKYGYISKKYVKVTSDFNGGATATPTAAPVEPAPTGTILGKVTASKIALRSESSSDSKAIREFTNKPSVYIYYRSGDYYYLQVAGTNYKGWMAVKYVKASDKVPVK